MGDRCDSFHEVVLELQKIQRPLTEGNLTTLGRTYL
jgi:hypothetical protein